jgi:hypothetical protein
MVDFVHLSLSMESLIHNLATLTIAQCPVSGSMAILGSAARPVEEESSNDFP